jgi:hypothetical protein
MAIKRTIKETITEAVRQQLPPDTTPTEKIITEWWFTRSGESLRLSAQGDLAFRQAEIEFYDLPLQVTQDAWNRFILDCGKKLKCPFFIGVNKNISKKPEPYIRLYDSKIAVLISLYGDIHSYLDSIKVRK